MKIGNQRAAFIDYRNPGIFMITMNKAPGIPNFSKLWIDGELTNPKRRVKLQLSREGHIIKDCFKDFKNNYSDLTVLSNKIMPDHIHFIVKIERKIEKRLGEVIAKFKREIYNGFLLNKLISPSVKTIFEPGFNDQILVRRRNLQVLFDYVADNPYRLWIRHEHPEFFSRAQNIMLHETPCNLYGNRFLLQHPFIYPVIIHRSYSEDEIKRLKDIWRYAIYNDGVLVGAFISKKEKEILNEALEFGSKIILISNKTFETREKPSGRLFEHCCNGNLLIVSPDLTGMSQTDRGISRQECLYLNNMAEMIGKGIKI